MFYPMRNSIALSEVLLSILPVSAIVEWLSANPTAAYNTAFALSFPLSGLAMFALVRALTRRNDAAVVSGLAYLLVPYRAEQLAHLQVLSYYWAPLALLGLHRYVETDRPRWLALFAIAWLAQALANGYAMFHFSILIGLWIVWFVRPWRSVWPILIAGAFAAAPMIPILMKYQEVHSSLHLARDINEIKRLSVDLADLSAAPAQLAVWGGRLGAPRPETAAFPGVTLIVLTATALWAVSPRLWSRGWFGGWRSIVGLAALVAAAAAASVLFVGPWRLGPLTVGNAHKPFSIAFGATLLLVLSAPATRDAWRRKSVIAFYVLAAFAMYLLAFGPSPTLLGTPVLYEPPYAWLMRLPGFATLRVPARFIMTAAVCQAILVGCAVSAWAVGPRKRLTVALFAAGLLIDGWFSLKVVAVPAPGISDWSATSVRAVLELPVGDPEADFGAMFRAMSHGVPIVNGVSGYVPPHYIPLVLALRNGEYAALNELGPWGPIAIAFDRQRPGALDIEKQLRELGLDVTTGVEGWGRAILPKNSARLALHDTELAIASITASVHQEDTGRMLDGDITSAWGTGIEQVGGEELTLDLGASGTVSGIELRLGPYSFGHPKSLQVATSFDGRTWSDEWVGALGALTVRAALEDPSVVPVSIGLKPVQARFIRLRQTGVERTIPMWIAELRVRGIPVLSAGPSLGKVDNGEP